nr:cell wall protein DAN4-like [Penaeus vannamei]
MINNCRPWRLLLLIVLIGGECSGRLFMHRRSKFEATVPTWTLPGSTSLCRCRNQCFVQPNCTAVSVQQNSSGVYCAFTAEPTPGNYLVNSNDADAVFATTEENRPAAYRTSAPTSTPSGTTTKTTDLEQEFQPHLTTSSPPGTSESSPAAYTTSSTPTSTPSEMTTKPTDLYLHQTHGSAPTSTPSGTTTDPMDLEQAFQSHSATSWAPETSENSPAAHKNSSAHTSTPSGTTTTPIQESQPHPATPSPPETPESSLADYETNALTSTPSETTTKSTDLVQELQSHPSTSSPAETSESSTVSVMNADSLPDVASEAGHDAFSQNSQNTPWRGKEAVSNP